MSDTSELDKLVRQFISLGLEPNRGADLLLKIKDYAESEYNRGYADAVADLTEWKRS